MILVDTPIWVDHFRDMDETLHTLLRQGRVFCHPMIVGEIAMGSLKRRDRIVAELDSLPRPNVAVHHEVMRFISDYKLFGRGIGYIDCHLIAAVRLTPDSSLWTRDKRLFQVASSLKIAFHSVQ